LLLVVAALMATRWLLWRLPRRLLWWLPRRLLWRLLSLLVLVSRNLSLCFLFKIAVQQFTVEQVKFVEIGSTVMASFWVKNWLLRMWWRKAVTVPCRSTTTVVAAGYWWMRIILFGMAADGAVTHDLCGGRGRRRVARIVVSI